MLHSALTEHAQLCRHDPATNRGALHSNDIDPAIFADGFAVGSSVMHPASQPTETL